MNCKIKHLVDNSGLDYWCEVHKAKATKIGDNDPTTCDCTYKFLYENVQKRTRENIKSIKIVYPDLNKNTNVQVIINDKEFKGILKLEESIIDLKDYGGLMLAKLNNIQLEASKCPYCGGMHTDNGVFAYTPHSKHLCIYCGHFYNVEEANIGNELALYFAIPKVNLEDKMVNIDDVCEVSYDLFEGEVLVNKINCNKLKRGTKEINLVDYLNEMLKEEY